MSRLGLINPLRGPCPPDGYRWKCPEDGWFNHAWDYATWVEQLGHHLGANPGHRNYSGEEMQEQLCLTLPPGWCNYDNESRARVITTQLEWSDVLRGSQALSNWILKGSPMVERSEAERRALICSRCYFNVRMTGCSACQATVAKLADALPATKYDFALNSCAACKCSLRMKVHFPNKILDKENLSVQESYPTFCWQKKDGPNYVKGSPALSN